MSIITLTLVIIGLLGWILFAIAIIKIVKYRQSILSTLYEIKKDISKVKQDITFFNKVR